MSKPFNPKSTVFTNLMLDIIMPSVTPNAWKILCFATRKTAGWADLSTNSGRKESDVISLSQFSKGCGIKSENTIMEAINYCIEKGYMLRQPDGQSYRYRLNTEYELTSSDIEVVNCLTSSEIEEVVTKTSSIIEDTNSKLINSNINTKSKKTKDSFSPAGRNGDNMRTKEEIMKGTEEAYLRSLSSATSDYAHIPEHARPWIQKVCELWNLKPPGRKAKDLGYWITGANDLQDACSEFGIDLLTDIHTEWRDGFQNGCAPWTINAPNSLVKTARGKAGMKRQGISGTIKQGKPKYHSLLDV